MAFIYPTCPSCNRKSEDGIPRHEMPAFVYDCPYCEFEGWGQLVFDPHSHVEWTDRSLEGVRGHKSSGLIRRFLDWL